MTRPASTLDDIALLSDLAADARDVYFIASGSVRVANWSYSGREVSFEDIPAGGTTFGELTAIVRQSTERIFNLSVKGANIRIYADLLRLADANVRDDNSAEITPIPVHSDIAARVSTTRETVARVMGDLSRRDLLTRAKDRLIVTPISIGWRN